MHTNFLFFKVDFFGLAEGKQSLGQQFFGSVIVSSTRVRPIWSMFLARLFSKRGLRIRTKVPNLEPLSSTMK
jgi:hypothetical protein